MALGPGKYDEFCTAIREQTDARLVAVIVVGGQEGFGFAVQGVPELVQVLPDMLRHVAKDVEADVT